MQTFKALVRSRKFWMTVIGFIAVSFLFIRGDVDAEAFVTAIVALIAVLNGANAYEDGQAKRNGNLRGRG